MSSASDAFAELIEHAVETAVCKALGAPDAMNRRLLSIEGAAGYLALSKREVYNMVSSRELAVVVHGRRKMLDIKDLERWIEQNKVLEL